MGHKLEEVWICAKGDSIQEEKSIKLKSASTAAFIWFIYVRKKNISRRTSGKIMNAFIVNGLFKTRQTNKTDVESPRAISEEPF